MVDNQEFVKEIQDRDKGFDGYLQAGKERRSARVVMHERMALFSAGTLSLMFTFVITQDGSAELITDSNRSLFMVAMGLFLVNMIAGVIMRIVTANEFFFLHCDNWLAKEEELIRAKHRKVRISKDRRKRGKLHDKREEVLHFMVSRIESIERSRKPISMRMSLYSFMQGKMVFLSTITFITAYSLTALFVANLILAT